MADSTTVLREYFVRLGFRVDENQGRKFDKNLAAWDKRADQLAKSLAGAALASTAMVTAFAKDMEKLYYASRRTDSAVGNLKALDYAARQVGVKDIQSSLEAMSRNLRSNPGLTGLLNSLGVPVKGRDKSDVLMDLVTQLKRMPFFVAERYANLFGIDSDTLFMLQDGLDKFKAANEQRKQFASEMGVDMDAAAKAGVEIANQWREVVERAGIFKDALIIRILPALNEMSEVSKEVLKDWTAIVQQGDVFARLLEGLGFKQTGGGVKLSKESEERLGVGEADKDVIVGKNLGTGEPMIFRKKLLDRMYDRFMKWAGSKKYQTPVGDQASVDAAQDLSAFQKGGTGIVPSKALGTPQAGQLADGGPIPQRASKAELARHQEAANAAAPLFRRLEKQYGLPDGWLGRVWAQESARGGNMLSSAGAQGHFQFMPATASQYGLKDPNNLEQSATASAKMFGYLLQKYDGDQQKAAAAYNWGEGRVDRYGLGRMPAETRNYVDAIAGGGKSVAFNQTNNVTVNGTSDPTAAANAVGAKIEQANSDVVRDMRIKVQ